MIFPHTSFAARRVRRLCECLLVGTSLDTQPTQPPKKLAPNEKGAKTSTSILKLSAMMLLGAACLTHAEAETLVFEGVDPMIGNVIYQVDDGRLTMLPPVQYLRTPASSPSLSAVPSVVFDGDLIFRASSPLLGEEWHRWDGRRVMPVIDATPGPAGAGSGSPVVFKGDLYFIAGAVYRQQPGSAPTIFYHGGGDFLDLKVSLDGGHLAISRRIGTDMLVEFSNGSRFDATHRFKTGQMPTWFARLGAYFFCLDSGKMLRVSADGSSVPVADPLSGASTWSVGSAAMWEGRVLLSSGSKVLLFDGEEVEEIRDTAGISVPNVSSMIAFGGRVFLSASYSSPTNRFRVFGGTTVRSVTLPATAVANNYGTFQEIDGQLHLLDTSTATVKEPTLVLQGDAFVFAGRTIPGGMTDYFGDLVRVSGGAIKRLEGAVEREVARVWQGTYVPDVGRSARVGGAIETGNRILVMIDHLPHVIDPDDGVRRLAGAESLGDFLADLGNGKVIVSRVTGVLAIGDIDLEAGTLELVDFGLAGLKPLTDQVHRIGGNVYLTAATTALPWGFYRWDGMNFSLVPGVDTAGGFGAGTRAVSRADAIYLSGTRNPVTISRLTAGGLETAATLPSSASLRAWVPFKGGVLVTYRESGFSVDTWRYFNAGGVPTPVMSQESVGSTTSFVNFRDEAVHFGASGTNEGLEPYVFDGSMIRPWGPLWPGLRYSFDLPDFVEIDNAAHLICRTAEHNGEFFRWDNSQRKGVLAFETLPGFQSIKPADPLVAGGQLYVVGSSQTNARELFIRRNPGGPFVSIFQEEGDPRLVSLDRMTARGDGVFFAASGPLGQSLWHHDAAGIRLILDLSADRISVTSNGFRTKHSLLPAADGGLWVGEQYASISGEGYADLVKIGANGAVSMVSTINGGDLRFMGPFFEANGRNFFMNEGFTSPDGIAWLDGGGVGFASGFGGQRLEELWEGKPATLAYSGVQLFDPVTNQITFLPFGSSVTVGKIVPAIIHRNALFIAYRPSGETAHRFLRFNGDEPPVIIDTPGLTMGDKTVFFQFEPLGSLFIAPNAGADGNLFEYKNGSVSPVPGSEGLGMSETSDFVRTEEGFYFRASTGAGGSEWRFHNGTSVRALPEMVAGPGAPEVLWATSLNGKLVANTPVGIFYGDADGLTLHPIIGYDFHELYPGDQYLVAGGSLYFRGSPVGESAAAAIYRFDGVAFDNLAPIRPEIGGGGFRLMPGPIAAPGIHVAAGPVPDNQAPPYGLGPIVVGAEPLLGDWTHELVDGPGYESGRFLIVDGHLILNTYSDHETMPMMRARIRSTSPQNGGVVVEDTVTIFVKPGVNDLRNFIQTHFGTQQNEPEHVRFESDADGNGLTVIQEAFFGIAPGTPAAATGAGASYLPPAMIESPWGSYLGPAKIKTTFTIGDPPVGDLVANLESSTDLTSTWHFEANVSSQGVFGTDHQTELGPVINSRRTWSFTRNSVNEPRQFFRLHIFAKP